MDATTALWSFALVAGLLTVTPGLDTALIVRTALLGRRRQALGVAAGIQFGTLVWGVLTSLGITAVLTASHLAYQILRWAGAGYLLWMGIRMIRDSWRHTPEAPEPVTAPGGLWTGLRRGALTNLLNPKVGVFYVALLPQFIPAGSPHLAFGVLLTCIHILLGITWSTTLITFSHAIRRWLSRPAARKVIDRVTGTVIAAFGVRLAVSD